MKQLLLQKPALLLLLGQEKRRRTESDEPLPKQEKKSRFLQEWLNIKGYTLLEILVVLVIMSIMGAMAVLTLGRHDSKQAEMLSQELAQTISLAEEQALLQPAILGLVFRADSYCFYEYRKSKSGFSWEPLSDSDLGLHRLPADIQLRLQLANKTVISQQKDFDAQGGVFPLVLISSNGSLTPFTIWIGKKDKKPLYVLKGYADGTVNSQIYEG